MTSLTPTGDDYFSRAPDQTSVFGFIPVYLKYFAVANVYITYKFGHMI